jgi:hypothetical protein
LLPNNTKKEIVLISKGNGGMPISQKIRLKNGKKINKRT